MSLPWACSGREVLGGPHDGAGARDVGGAGPGDPEVRDAGAAVLVDEDVLRLQVAVDDPLAMGEARCAQDLAGEVDRVLGGHPTLDELLQLRPVDVLHRDEVGVAELAAIEDADDVRVLEAGRGLGLAAEALDELLVLREAVVQHLDRDVAIEFVVVRQPDVGHASRAELVLDHVALVDHGPLAHLGHLAASSLFIRRTRCSPAAPRAPAARSGAATVAALAARCARPSPRSRSRDRLPERSR